MSSGDIVKLNIGGKIFQTTRDTLTKYDGYFRAMFESGIPLKLDDTGCIFIDRSPRHFDTILNFLRDGDIPIPENNMETQQLLKEAQYYTLERLIYLLGGEASLEWKKENLRGWEGAQVRGEVRLTSDEKEIQDFRSYSEDKPTLEIDYSTRYWGDIHENPLIQNFVKKHCGTWNILFIDIGDEKERPFYSIYPFSDGKFGQPQLPQLTCMAFLEQVERAIEINGLWK